MMSQLLGNLVGSAVLMGAVLLVRRPVARAFGARAAFLLWLAPLLRLLFPKLHLPVQAPMPDVIVETQVAAAASIAPAGATLPTLGLLLAICWAAGAILFITFHLLRYSAFVRRAIAGAKPLSGSGLEDIEVLETPLVSGPAAAGLVRRRIFVPVGFATLFEPEQQRLALRHEMLHHRRGDLWAGAAALVVLAAHWFNPLAFAAHRAFRRDLEAACDADLLAGAGPPERQAYARTIVRCAAQPMPQPICALTDCKELKGRLTMMKQDTRIGRRIAGAAIALALSGGGLAMASPATGQAKGNDEVRTEVRKVIIHGKGEGNRNMSIDSSARIEQCAGEKVDVSANASPSPGKMERTRIMVCAKPGETKAEMAAGLEKALTRLESDKDLSATARADIIAKLKAKIAELRAGQ